MNQSGVLERELMKTELGHEDIDVLGRGIRDIDPDERVLDGQDITDPIQRQIAIDDSPFGMNSDLDHDALSPGLSM
jgi:hypothetical protein